MKIMLVGGAVRDKLLGLEIKDEDWLVVGGTPEYFTEKGYEQVGKDFPVFLHPETKDEYALARKERKVGKGYTGFEFDFDPSVTAEEDLFRRDLTINAMAIDEDGSIIDPFGGLDDLKNKVLRHVSDHFKEDPVRVLRVARFMSRYGGLGFTVADETMQLMKDIVNNGEINNLTSERVLLEIQKTFKEPNPSLFFEVLRKCGALKVILPEVDSLFGVPQREDYHPEIDTGIHTLMVLEQAKTLSNRDFDVMFSALVHDLGKGITPKEMLPQHLLHEKNGLPLVDAVCERLKVPSETKKLALLVTEYHLLAHSIKNLNSVTLFNFFKKADAFRNPEICNKFAIACEADARGRTGYENDTSYDIVPYLKHILEHINLKKDPSKVIKIVDDMIENKKITKSEKGKSIGEFMRNQYVELISEAKHFYKPNILKTASNYKDKLVNFNVLSTENKMDLFNSLNVQKNTFLITLLLDTLEIKNDKLLKCANEYSELKGASYLEKGLLGSQIRTAITEDRLAIFEKYFPKKILKKNKP